MVSPLKPIDYDSACEALRAVASIARDAIRDLDRAVIRRDPVAIHWFVEQMYAIRDELALVLTPEELP